MADQSQSARRAETLATVLLSAATVFTAWSAFQSAKWSGVQATSFSQASATRTESVRASTQAGQQSLGDVSQFTAWLDAQDQRQTAVAVRTAATFRGELETAFEAWEALSPLTNPAAPATPFDLPSYQLASDARASQLETLATVHSSQATDANQRSDNYVLLTVFFSMVLFFGAVGSRIGSAKVARTMLVLGGALFLLAVVVAAMLPIKV